MKDMERSLSRTEWREAATGGLYAGLAYALLTIAAHAGRSMPGLVTILNAVSFFSFAGFLYFYARRMAAYAGGDGFSYGRSLLFVLKMSLFAGVLAGVGQFVLVNWIDPEGFREQFDLMVANMAGGGMGEKEAEMAGSLGLKLMRNPLFAVFSGIFSMLIYGGLLGLLISIFVRASRRSVRRRNVCRIARVRVVRTKKPSARFGGGIRRRMCK